MTKKYTFPNAAAAKGWNLDQLRKLKAKLAAEGLCEKIGTAWVIEEQNLNAVADHLRASERNKLAPANG